MRYCVKCGNELFDDQLFCNVCGEKHIYAVTSPVEEITIEKGIEMTADLKKKYIELEKIEHQLYENNKFIENFRSTPNKYHSFFRFFWPTLIVAASVLLGSSIIEALLLSDKYSHTNAYYVLTDAIPIILMIATLIIGGVIASKKRFAANEAIQAGIRKEEEEVKMRREANEKLAASRAEINADLAEYNTVIPRPLRNSSSIGYLNRILKNGSASSWESAVAMAKSRLPRV